MEQILGLGIYVNTARYVWQDFFFRDGNLSTERTVNCYELVLFLKDGGYSVINGEKYPITAGSIRFHKPGDRVYSYRFYDIYVLHFSVDSEDKGKKVFADFPSFVKVNDIEKAEALMKKAVSALVTQDDFCCLASVWSLLQILKDGGYERRESKIDTIKKYIKQHMSQKITLSQLATAFYLHPVYLQRKFKEEMGITPSEYLKRVRISCAKTLLLTTDQSIEAIAEECGFCNTSYFIKQFKQESGLTPAQFRRDKYLSPALI